MTRSYLQRFNIEISENNLIEKFFTRMNFILERLYLPDEQYKLFAFKLGIPERHDRYGYKIQLAGYFTGLDLDKYLYQLQILIDVLFKQNFESSYYTHLIDGINSCIINSEQQLNFYLKTYKDKSAQIYPRGNKLLDNVINDNIERLTDDERYQTIAKDYNESLKFFLKKDYESTIIKAYKSLENLAKILLKNNSPITKNKELLCKKFNINNKWGNILHYIVELGNEYGRHSKGTTLDDIETEAYLYSTGTIINMILKKEQNEY